MTHAQIWFVLIAGAILAFYAITAWIANSPTPEDPKPPAKASAQADPAEFPRWGS